MSADTAAQPLTGARARTHRAILDGAAAVLAANSSASLGEIADTAGVTRSTIYRYFPERADLLAALAADARERAGQALQRARMDEGTGAEAIQRWCLESVELIDVLPLVFNETLDPKDIYADADEGAVFAAAVTRGHLDGSIDPRLTAGWLSHVYDGLFFSVAQAMHVGDVSRYEAVPLLLTTVRKILAPTADA